MRDERYAYELMPPGSVWKSVGSNSVLAFYQDPYDHGDLRGWTLASDTCFTVVSSRIVQLTVPIVSCRVLLSVLTPKLAYVGFSTKDVNDKACVFRIA